MPIVSFLLYAKVKTYIDSFYRYMYDKESCNLFGQIRFDEMAWIFKIETKEMNEMNKALNFWTIFDRTAHFLQFLTNVTGHNCA